MHPVCCAGVDPKSVLCEYFKVGQCTKGFKCKYSHDLNIGRKTQKIDLFTDKCGAAAMQLSAELQSASDAPMHVPS